MQRADPSSALDALLAREPAIRRGVRRDAADALPSGFEALDAALPGGGWARGGVTELLCDAPGIGELSLLLPMLRALTAAGRRIALVAPPHVPYAPAFVNAGVDPDGLLVVECPRDADALWAAELLLREGAVAALALWAPRTTPARQRRLQLAAAEGGAVAVVYRPGAARAEHAPVSARIALAVRDGRLELELLKLRGGCPGTVRIEPSAFDAAQGAEWLLAPCPGLTVSAAPAPIVALAPRALPDAPARFAGPGSGSAPRAVPVPSRPAPDGRRSGT